MELVFEYWAQIALILTIIVGGIKFFLDASVRKSEIQYSTATKLRFDLAREYVLAYTDLYQKLSAVSSHLRFGSWEDDKLVPVLESYNSSY